MKPSHNYGQFYLSKIASMQATPIQILYIEDDPGDAELVRLALTKAESISAQLTVIDRSQEALDYLLKKGQYLDAIRPDLILLDLNLPGVSGKDILKYIKKSQSFCAIPVIVFSTSNSLDDIRETYDLGANSYVIKQNGLQIFLSRMVQIIHYWIEVSELPRVKD